MKYKAKSIQSKNSSMDNIPISIGESMLNITLYVKHHLAFPPPFSQMHLH